MLASRNKMAVLLTTAKGGNALRLKWQQNSSSGTVISSIHLKCRVRYAHLQNRSNKNITLSDTRMNLTLSAIITTAIIYRYRVHMLSVSLRGKGCSQVPKVLRTMTPRNKKLSYCHVFRVSVTNNNRFWN